MNVWRKGALVFAAMVVLDIVFARYTLATAAREAMAASLWAVAIQCCNFVVITGFINDRRMYAPCLAGAFVGTYIALTV